MGSKWWSFLCFNLECCKFVGVEDDFCYYCGVKLSGVCPVV